MAWTNSYTCTRLGVVFNKGEKFIVKGQSKVSAYSGSSNGYNYTNDPTEKALYGVYSESGTISYPICIADSAGNSQYFINDACIYENVNGRCIVTIDLNGATNGNGLWSTIYPKPGVKDYWTFGSNIPSKTGHTFKGLYTAKTGGTQVYGSNGHAVSGDYWTASGGVFLWKYKRGVSLYAQWQANTYTYSFNTDGGSSVSNQTKTYGVHFTFPAAPTKAGYTFNGWWTRSGTVYAASTQYAGLPDANTTWYAKWTANTYNITYNGNGGVWDGKTTWTDYATTDTFYKVVDNSGFYVRAGYRFNGWSTSSTTAWQGGWSYATDGASRYWSSNDQLYHWQGTYLASYGNPTLYANWVQIFNFNVRVYLNGSIINNTNIFHCDVSINNSTVATDVGGYSASHDTGSTWSVGGLATASGYTRYSTGTTSGTLNAATWCNIYIGQNYTITYNANGGSGTTTQTVNYGTAWTTKGAICTKTGYKQVSWNTKADGTGTTYALSTAQTNAQTSNLTLYAIYEATGFTNTIGHWAEGFTQGEGNNGSKTCYQIANTTFWGQIGSTYTLDASRATTIPNGYYLLDVGTSYISGTYTKYKLGQQFTVKESSGGYFEYTYRPYSYTITYNLGGGENNPLNPSSYNVLYGVTLHKPIRDGYKFLGWNDGTNTITGINEGVNARFTSASDLYSQLANRRTGNITLTAQWQALTADEKKVYIYNNGNISAAQFRESDTKFGFYNTGTVYAKKFVEGSSQFKVTSDKIMYAKQFIERT